MDQLLLPDSCWPALAISFTFSTPVILRFSFPKSISNSGQPRPSPLLKIDECEKQKGYKRYSSSYQIEVRNRLDPPRDKSDEF
ncbi:hypothetical protein FGO68_gene8081 [Halteria grandinella]|uniref:Uncharacterized protein n=1 Tax=Halteria grandinella TaxID=5974 RepID=A0A8J8NCW6_HALGN|nr:hypothetical protein FGO68_gene8081 [Halteria grandinella]